MTCALARRLLLAVGGAAVLLQFGWASPEGAKSAAAEAVARQDGEGFQVRADHWSGRFEDGGGRKMLRHQLFRGNEYWFWLGSSPAGAGGTPPPTLRVYDATGHPVDVEVQKGEDWASARVLPPKSGVYLIVVERVAGAEGGCDWSLSYGYR